MSGCVTGRFRPSSLRLATTCHRCVSFLLRGKNNMRAPRPAGLTGILAVAALTLAACGGGTTSSSTPTAAGSVAPTVAPATSEPSTGTAASPSAAIALPSFDLTQLATSLENVDSYRITIVTNGETQYSGVVVTKPVLARDVIVSGSRFVVIGDEVWTGTGDQLVPAPPELAATMLAAFDPAMLVGAFAQPGAMAGAQDLGSEDKNGIRAKHFKIDGTSIVGTLASMPPGATIDIWIAEDGYLASLVVVGMAGGDFSLDVTNVNDPANVVERPE